MTCGRLSCRSFRIIMTRIWREWWTSILRTVGITPTQPAARRRRSHEQEPKSKKRRRPLDIHSSKDSHPMPLNIHHYAKHAWKFSEIPSHPPWKSRTMETRSLQVGIQSEKVGKVKESRQFQAFKIQFKTAVNYLKMTPTSRTREGGREWLTREGFKPPDDACNPL